MSYGFRNAGSNAPRKEDGLVVFFRDPTEEELAPDLAASMAKGHPVFEDQVICEVRIPGDPRRTMAAPHTAKCMVDGVWVTYADRFPEEYKRYLGKKNPAAIGTPLDRAPFLSTAKKSELRSLNIYTIEALAEVDGSNIRNLGMGGGELREKARDWLKGYFGGDSDSSMADENEGLKQQIKFMMEEISSLKAASVAPTKDPTTLSLYDHWDEPALKRFIRQKTGESIRNGTPKSDLVARAEEVKDMPDLSA